MNHEARLPQTMHLRLACLNPDCSWFTLPCGGMTVMLSPEVTADDVYLNDHYPIHASFCAVDDQFSRTEGIRKLDFQQLGGLYEIDDDCDLAVIALRVLLSSDHNPVDWLRRVREMVANFDEPVSLITSGGREVCCWLPSEEGDELYNPEFIRQAVKLDGFFA